MCPCIIYLIRIGNTLWFPKGKLEEKMSKQTPMIEIEKQVERLQVCRKVGHILSSAL